MYFATPPDNTFSLSTLTQPNIFAPASVVAKSDIPSKNFLLCSAAPSTTIALTVLSLNGVKSTFLNISVTS